MKKFLGLIIAFTLLFSLAGVIALSDKGENKYEISEKFSQSKLMQFQNSFQERYQFSCSGECTYAEDGENVRLRIQDQKRVQITERFYFDLPIKEEYVINEDGQVLAKKRNIWAYIFGGTNEISNN